MGTGDGEDSGCKAATASDPHRRPERPAAQSGFTLLMARLTLHRLYLVLLRDALERPAFDST